MSEIILVLCGHGQFALGIKSALSQLNHAPGDVLTIDLQENETEAIFHQRLEVLIKPYEGRTILFLVDLAGSIPYKCASELVGQGAVIAGINLGMVVELEQMRHYVQDIDALVAQALLVGKEQILALESPL